MAAEMTAAAATASAAAASSAADDKKLGTRVFKKTSQNGKITTYLGKRDFLDRGDTIDLIDGMVLVDRDYIASETKVTVQLLAAFRYGREDLDVLGLTFRKDLISQCFQVFPPEPDATQTRPLTRLQERLRKKLGDNAFPFWFEIPPNSASSVTLQPAQGDTGKPCGVDYEIRTVVGSEAGTDKPKKHSSVRLAIRKLTYSPKIERPQPMVDAMKEFIISPGGLHLEASLDREMYYHGETISVNVHIQNNSNKTVKKIKVSVVQVADICIFTTASYSCDVDKIESYEGFPVGPGSTLSKVYTLCPLLLKNKDKRGLALDGQLKHEDTNLASSTTDIPLEIAPSEKSAKKLKLRQTAGTAAKREDSTGEAPISNGEDAETIGTPAKASTEAVEDLTKSDKVEDRTRAARSWRALVRRMSLRRRSAPTPAVAESPPQAPSSAAVSAAQRRAAWVQASLDGQDRPAAVAHAVIVKRRTSHSISLKRPTRYASLTQSMRENLGIIVQYKVKIRLFIAGPLGGELSAELPFTLTHSKPAGEVTPPPASAGGNGNTSRVINYASMAGANGHDVASNGNGTNGNRNAAVAQPIKRPEEDVDLIHFDSLEDDLIFEDFARIRVRGMDSADESKSAAI